MKSTGALSAMTILSALILMVTGCGGGAAPTAAAVAQTTVVEKVITTTPGPQPTQGPQAGSLAINGAGATFPYPLYSKWFYDYAFVDPAAKFNYQSIGSGGGIAQITAKTVDFGASDAILNDDQFSKAPGIQMFPTVAGAEVLAYNLTGDDGKPITATIKFPYTSIADIYLGKIKKWNEPVLQNANPDVKLPNKDIIVVHRSDGSGTTFVFTDYLSKVSSDWKSQVGSATSVKWPTGLGGKGNEGVSGTVAQNDGALGYVELAYALTNKLPYGIPANKSGTYVDVGQSLDGVKAAMSDFGTNLRDKLALSIVDPPGKDSYPIAAYTYLLLYMDQQDCAKAKKIIEFIKWAQSDAGLKDASDLKYVPLPDDIKKQVLDKLSKITCKGQPLT